MKPILFLILLLLFSKALYSQSGSCAPENCDDSKPYNYAFCTPEGLVYKCAINPFDVDAAGLPFGSLPAKIGNLPICYKRGGRLVTLPLPIAPNSLNEQDTKTDLQKSADAWNCICDNTSGGGCQTEIYIESTFEKKYFKDPYNQHSASTELTGTPNFFADPTYCEINADEMKVYINNTDEFMYNEDHTGYGNVVVNESIATNPGYMTQLKSMYPDMKIYNLVDVARYRMGLMLGIGTSGADCFGNDCGGVDEPKPLETAGSSPELSDDEKCAFKRLYCNVSIYEYEPQTQKVYPNPGYHVISIDFTLPDYCENVRMYIQNPLGQVVLVPIENIAFEGGDHTELINVDSLPVGVYYIIIEAGAYLSAQPINVIR